MVMFLHEFVLIVSSALLVQIASSQTTTCQATGNCDVVSGTNDASCDYGTSSTSASACDTVSCDHSVSCNGASISDSQNLLCTGCQGASISNVDYVQCTTGACNSIMIEDIPIDAEIHCDGSEGGSPCANADISSTNPFLLTCQGTIGEDYAACYFGLALTNPGGSVYCYGGSSSAGTCAGLPIPDSIGCVICGNKDACQDVTIGDMDVPADQIYIQPTCTANQVLSFLNKFHPEGGTDCENDTGSSDYCDVVEAYCDNNPNDANCLEEFQFDSEGSWVKEEVTCTASPDGGNCEVNADNDATCTGTDTTSYTVDSCDAIRCTDRRSCYGNIFTNSDDLKCNGRQACEQASVSSVTDLICSGGNRACEDATISNVPQGGSVDCGDATEAFSYNCNYALISSEDFFALTCAGTPGTSVLACANGHVTNPEGSVFCYGGTADNGICHGLTISNSVGCVICGSEDACENVQIVDSGGNQVHKMGNHQVGVYSTCEASDIVDFLNKVHPDGGTVSCEDDGGDGVCDVVEKYCARKRRDANCEDEFQVVDGSWTKEKITSTNDIDPDSFVSKSSDNGDDGDKIGRESWIVGSVVIVVFLLVMTAIVFCLCRKHPLALKQKETKVSQEEKGNGISGTVTDDVGEKEEITEHV